MDLQLKGKNALVSASSAGIGFAIAQGLAEQGVNVAIFSRNQQSIARAAQQIEAAAKSSRVIAFAGDVSKTDDLSRIIRETRAQLGSIDILVNNQGGPAPGGIAEVSDAQIESAYRSNLLSVLYSMRECLPEMKARRWGRILNILSISAKEPIPGLLLSNMFRPAVLGLAKTLASEVAAFGVTINSLLPNSVLTQRTRTLVERKALEKGIDFESALKESNKSLPIGYCASPEEFAQMAIFLCSPKASYISGTAVPVDAAASRALY
jgi:3-oxoacyl-[acyl-carrier protein] reductase